MNDTQPIAAISCTINASCSQEESDQRLEMIADQFEEDQRIYSEFG